MTLVQRYFKVRGIRMTEIAEATGYEVSSIHKTLAGSTYRNKGGEVRHRQSPKVRQAIAMFAGLPYEHLWGRRSRIIMTKLIREEIERQAAVAAEEAAKALTAKYLDSIKAA